MVFSGKRLRAAREAQGLTQLELALRVGVNDGPRAESIISAYERGQRDPSGKRVMLLARVLGVTAEHFYLYGPRKKATQDA